MTQKFAFSCLGSLFAAALLSAQSAPGPASTGTAAQPSAVPPADAQAADIPPPVTFRVQVDYVEVDAVVTDAQGNPVRDLRREDFEVFEDGKPQKIELFTALDVPVTRPEQPLFSPTPIERDVRTNAPFEGRIYVFVLDDLHTYALRSRLVQRAARQFIEQNMGANDLAAVVHLSGRSDAGQDFTGNKRLLIAAVEKFMGRKLQSPTMSRLDAYNQQQRLATEDSSQEQRRVDDPEDAERGYNARTAMDSLGKVATFMEGVRGRRKAVLYFSEGIDYNTYDVFSNREATTVLDAVRGAIGAATRANVAFYTVDPRGLTSLADETIEMQGAFPTDQRLGISQTSLQSDLQLAQDSLRTLADETGGYAVVNTNDFRGAFERIVRENSSYYVLGYYPTNDRRDGRLRKISVRVKRPGLEVRARKGYVAPRGKPEPRAPGASGTSVDLAEALNSPVPESGVAMIVHAAPFKGEGAKASVLITTQLEGRKFKFTEKDGQSLDTLELSFVAVDPKGDIKGGDRQRVDLHLRPETRQMVEAAGFRTLSRIELQPGRYQLRVGAKTAATGAIGTVLYDLEVPDFSKEPFSISGLVLASNFNSAVRTAPVKDPIAEVLKIPPTSARDFSVADTLQLFAEIYDNQASSPHQVDITTTLRATDGRPVLTTREQRSSDELQGTRGGYGYVTEMELKDVTPGEYVLRVEAQSRLAGSTPVMREALVKIWPARQAQSSAAAAPAKPIVSVARGGQSGVETASTSLARTDQEWQTIWSRLQLRSAMPKVNFENTMIAAVFLGQRPSAGYGVEIVDVRRDGETLVIEYIERTPPPGTASADVITTPFALAGVPMHSGEVRFEKVDAVR